MTYNSNSKVRTKIKVGDGGRRVREESRDGQVVVMYKTKTTDNYEVMKTQYKTSEKVKEETEHEIMKLKLWKPIEYK